MRRYIVELTYSNGKKEIIETKGFRNGAGILKAPAETAVKCVIRSPRGNVLSVCMREGNTVYYKPACTEY